MQYTFYSKHFVLCYVYYWGAVYSSIHQYTFNIHAVYTIIGFMGQDRLVSGDTHLHIGKYYTHMPQDRVLVSSGRFIVYIDVYYCVYYFFHRVYCMYTPSSIHEILWGAFLTGTRVCRWQYTRPPLGYYNIYNELVGAGSRKTDGTVIYNICRFFTEVEKGKQKTYDNNISLSFRENVKIFSGFLKNSYYILYITTV